MATEVGQLVLKVDTSEVKSAEAAVERLGDASQDTTQKTKIMQSQTKKTNVTVGDFGRKAGMAGIQVEQLAGQIAMGQNPLRAFGVQAADLGFILGVPLLGAVVGIASAVGSVLIPMLFSAAKDTEELVEQFEELDRVFNELTIAQQTVYLKDMNEKIAEMKDESAEAQEEINRLTEEMNRMTGSGAMVEGQTQRLIDQMLAQQAIIDTNTQLTKKMTDALNRESEAEREAREEKEKSEKASIRAAERELKATMAKMDAADRYVEKLAGLADNELQALERKEATQLETINSYREQNLITEQEYQDALTAIVASGQAARNSMAIAAQEEEMERNESRLDRIKEENDRMMAEAIAHDEKKKASAMQTTDSLLAFEDVLMKGKSEKQKAGFRVGVNLMNAEKRENAKTIVSNSYTAAMKAYASLAGIPIIGPALGAAAAATILAAGVSFAAQSLSGRALGGQVRAGESYVVGERGPEVLTMGAGGRITPNEALGGGGGQVVNRTANVSFSIQANDTQGFDDLLTQRRGTIMQIINEALNDNGQAALA